MKAWTGRPMIRWPMLVPSIRPAVLFGVATIVCLPLLGAGFSFDQGVFSAIADTLLRGGVAYRDAWEHKPPGVFYVYYLAFLLIDREIWAVRLLELLAIAASAPLLFKLVERRCGSPLAGAVSALMLPLLYLSFGRNTAQPESFQIPLIIGALLLLSRPAPGPWKCFLGGALLSIAVLFKTPLILLAPCLLGEQLLRDRQEPSLWLKARRTLVGAAGLLLPPLVLFGYYACRGAARPLFDALFVYPARYASVGLSRTWGSHLLQCFGWTDWLLCGSSTALLAAGIVRGARVRGLDTLRWGATLLALFGTVVIQGRYFDYHHLPMVPALAWGMGLFFSTEPSSTPERPAPATRLRRGLTFLGIVLAAAAGGQYLWNARARVETLGYLARFDQDNRMEDSSGTWAAQRVVARDVRDATRRDDRLFVWGDQPLLYVLSDRRMAGPNSHLMQIVPSWGESERVGPLLERLAREQPRRIIVTPDSLWWRDGQTTFELLQFFPEVQSFLRENYALVPGPLGYQYWDRRSP